MGELLRADILSWEQKQKFFGTWIGLEYRPKFECLHQKLPVIHRSCELPGLVPFTEVWLLRRDSMSYSPFLLTSAVEHRRVWHWLGPAGKETLTVRVSTTWYLYDDGAPGGQHWTGDQLRAVIAKHRPSVLCRLVKDVRFDRPDKWTDKYLPEEWSPTIVAEGTHPATMPTP